MPIQPRPYGRVWEHVMRSEPLTPDTAAALAAHARQPKGRVYVHLLDDTHLSAAADRAARLADPATSADELRRARERERDARRRQMIRERTAEHAQAMGVR